MILLSILGAWLFADFISGVGHWFEDRMLLKPSRVRVIESVRTENIKHHAFPGSIVYHGYWENIRESAAIAWPIALASWFVGAPLVVWLGLFFVGFANLVHRFAHTRRAHLNCVIKSLQWTGFFISHFQHGKHHYRRGKVLTREEASGTYCTMTSWLNPILDWVSFWPALEWIVRRR